MVNWFYNQFLTWFWGPLFRIKLMQSSSFIGIIKLTFITESLRVLAANISELWLEKCLRVDVKVGHDEAVRICCSLFFSPDVGRPFKLSSTVSTHFQLQICNTANFPPDYLNYSSNFYRKLCLKELKAIGWTRHLQSRV